MSDILIEYEGVGIFEGRTEYFKPDSIREKTKPLWKETGKTYVPRDKVEALIEAYAKVEKTKEYPTWDAYNSAVKQRDAAIADIRSLEDKG